MKKTFILFLAAATALCACTKEKAPVAQENEIEITVGASIENNGTRTYYVPEGNKVFWIKEDKLGLKYTKTSATSSSNDNIQLTLVNGDSTNIATFKGKLGKSNADPDGQAMVFYYPHISAIAKSGSVTSANDFILGGSFPKIQNTGDVNLEPNLMYGVATNVTGWPTTTESTSPIEVTMKNVMSVLDFTIKGTGAIQRIYITDLNSSAKGMYGDYTVQITNGEIDSFASLPAASSDLERTITAEFNKPIVLSAEGSHAYVTVMPREYSSGIKVGIELTDGSYMIKKISTSFTTESNKAYSVPELTFTAAPAGKGMAENVEYSYQTFTDGRDQEVYRYATLKDGRDWMLDNLRYLPESLEIGDKLTDINAGVWYPVVMNAEGNGMTFGTADDVNKYGYAYNLSVAFDQDPEAIYDLQKDVINKTITAAAANNEIKGWDNKGICPDGWHIPTDAEYTALYTTAYKSNVTALSADGFSFRGAGYFNIGNKTSATSDPSAGTLGGYVNNRFNMTYLILSAFSASGVQHPYLATKSAMFNGTNYTAGLFNMNARFGAPLRCIKDKEK